MNIDTTKLLKHVDGDVWRRFRAYCVAEGLNMGPAISTLMLSALMGKVKIEYDDTDGGVIAKSKTGSWQWPDDRDEGSP